MNIDEMLQQHPKKQQFSRADLKRITRKYYDSQPRPLTLEQDFAQLQQKYPDATLSDERQGYRLLTIPNWDVGEGYKPRLTTFYAPIPTSYPMAPPERFYTDKVFLLGGGWPACSDWTNHHRMFPELNDKMWHMWKVVSWNWRSCRLVGYTRAMRARFNKREHFLYNEGRHDGSIFIYE